MLVKYKKYSTSIFCIIGKLYKKGCNGKYTKEESIIFLISCSKKNYAEYII